MWIPPNVHRIGQKYKEHKWRRKTRIKSVVGYWCIPCIVDFSELISAISLRLWLWARATRTYRPCAAIGYHLPVMNRGIETITSKLCRRTMKRCRTRQSIIAYFEAVVSRYSLWAHRHPPSQPLIAIFSSRRNFRCFLPCIFHSTECCTRFELSNRVIVFVANMERWPKVQNAWETVDTLDAEANFAHLYSQMNYHYLPNVRSLAWRSHTRAINSN